MRVFGQAIEDLARRKLLGPNPRDISSHFLGRGRVHGSAQGVEIARGGMVQPAGTLLTMISQAEYEAEKARLKDARKAAGEKLREARRSGTPREHSDAVQAYVATQDNLEAFYREHLGPAPTRAERRCAVLRARGIAPVWEMSEKQYRRSRVGKGG